MFGTGLLQGCNSAGFSTRKRLWLLDQRLGEGAKIHVARGNKRSNPAHT
jgi:hypothetical protein